MTRVATHGAVRRLLRAWWPAPGLSVLLLLAWLMLNQSVSLGHMLLGALLALALPHFTHRRGAGCQADTTAPAPRRRIALVARASTARGEEFEALAAIAATLGREPRRRRPR